MFLVTQPAQKSKLKGTNPRTNGVNFAIMNMLLVLNRADPQRHADQNGGLHDTLPVIQHMDSQQAGTTRKT